MSFQFNYATIAKDHMYLLNVPHHSTGLQYQLANTGRGPTLPGALQQLLRIAPVSLAGALAQPT